MPDTISQWGVWLAANLSTSFGVELSALGASCFYALIFAVPFIVTGFLLRFFLRLFKGD